MKTRRQAEGIRKKAAEENIRPKRAEATREREKNCI
jgi:hypothetical protein